MDYEKKYKEALEMAKDFYKGYKQRDNQLYANDLETIFPELCESEDEKIRKEIIKFLELPHRQFVGERCQEEWIAWLEKQGEKTQQTPQWMIDFLDDNRSKFASLMEDYDEQREAEGKLLAIIAWLEKQGKKETLCDKCRKEHPSHSCQDITELGKCAVEHKQKTTDKVEPKFKVGDWIIDNCGYVWKIEGILNQFYILEGVEGGESRPTIEWVDKTFHLWTIQDAKDGDVLAFKNNVGGIIICKSPTNYDTRSYCRLIRDNLINKEESGWDSTLLVPATKEQRDTLLKAMADAGYTFDFEKKELKKIEDEEVNGEDYGIDGLWHAQRILEKTLGKVEGYQTDDGILGHKAAITAVKKLYEQKPAWSEEDEHRINRISDFIWKNRKGDTDEIYQQEQDVDWLKSLKNKVQPQPKQEWSEEDEKRLKSCLNILQPKTLLGNVETINTKWLKSLKDRYTWRPNNEQIDTLEHFIRSIGESGYASPYDNNTKLLYSLLEQLKKLTE